MKYILLLRRNLSRFSLGPTRNLRESMNNDEIPESWNRKIISSSPKEGKE
jgi:hypothetical protein